MGHITIHNGNSYARQDQSGNPRYDSRTLALAQYRTLDDSHVAPYYGHSDPDHRPSRRGGRKSDEASSQCNVLGHAHRRPTRYDGESSDQASPRFDVSGGPAVSQNSASYGDVYPPHMTVTSRNNPRAEIEDGILAEGYGPPLHEVAARGQAMAQYVDDWSTDWERMEWGRSNASGGARGV